MIFVISAHTFPITVFLTDKRKSFMITSSSYILYFVVYLCTMWNQTDPKSKQTKRINFILIHTHHTGCERTVKHNICTCGFALNNSEPPEPNLSQPIYQGANTPAFSIWKTPVFSRRLSLVFTVFPMTPSCIMADWVHARFLTNVHFADDGDNYSLWDVRAMQRYSASRAVLQMEAAACWSQGKRQTWNESCAWRFFQLQCSSASSPEIHSHCFTFLPVLSPLFNTKPCYLIPWHDFTLQKRTEASQLALLSVWCMLLQETGRRLAGWHGDKPL